MNLGFGWFHLPFHVDWGSLPSYFTGFSLIAAVMTLSGNRKDRRSGQASKVSVWATPPERDDENQWRVKILNASDLAITEVKLAVSASRDSAGAPTSGLRYSADLGPGESFFYAIEGFPIAWKKLDFIDASGQRWVRTPKKLRRMRSPERLLLRMARL